LKENQGGADIQDVDREQPIHAVPIRRLRRFERGTRLIGKGGGFASLFAACWRRAYFAPAGRTPVSRLDMVPTRARNGAAGKNIRLAKLRRKRKSNRAHT